jgi:hypothetical protein
VRVTPQCDSLDSSAICKNGDSQFGPSITFDGTNYVVVWSDRRFNAVNWWITAARVAPDGVVLDTGIPLGTQDAHNEYYPDIASDGSRSLVAWYRSYYAPWGIYARFVNSQAQPEDSCLLVATTRTHVANYAKVAFGQGCYLVVWSDLRPGADDYDIFGRFVTPSGQMPDTAFSIATGEASQTRPDVELVGSDFLVVWNEAGRIVGRRVVPQGGPAGAQFAVSDTTNYSRDCPRLTNLDGNYLAVWSENRGTDSDIYCRIGTFPGVEESHKPQASSTRPQPTLVCELPVTPTSGKGRYFDCLGRAVTPGHAAAGIYFLTRPSGRTCTRIVLEK